jgi:endoglucanase
MAADWGPAAVAREIARAGAWAKAKGVAVYCNEFGAIRAGVDAASRYRWLGDVRRAAEVHGMGWTVWEYTHIFGLTQQSSQTGQVGRRTMDEAAFGALGLAAPVAASR